MVACEAQNTVSGKFLRVVGLRVSSVMVLTNLTDASLSMSLPLKIRSIALGTQKRLTKPESRTLCRALQSIPSLRSLNLNAHLQEECELPQLHGFEFSNAERRTPPNAISYVCKFENLRSLEILAHLTALPSCIGHTLGVCFAWMCVGTTLVTGTATLLTP